MFEALELSMTGCYILSRLGCSPSYAKKYQKWYTIDALGVIFTSIHILATFSILNTLVNLKIF